jgi:hypothetical protein
MTGLRRRGSPSFKVAILKPLSFRGGVGEEAVGELRRRLRSFARLLLPKPLP